VARNSTIGRSLSAGHARLALFVAVAAVFAIHTVVVFTADAQARAEAQVEVQSLADAAALGSAAELPHGAVAVLRAASRIIGSQTQRSRRSSEQKVQVGHWDAQRQTFSSDAMHPDAVEITIRLRNEPPFTALSGSSEPIEGRAIAVFKPAGKTLVAQARETSASAAR